jgi:30S ribosomal protein S31
MGKGDVKSKKGKISKGTFGNSRKKKNNKVATAKAPAKAAAAAK